MFCIETITVADEIFTTTVCGHFRQEDGVQPHSASGSVNGELPPISRTGSPTTADKDILVCHSILHLCIHPI